MKGKIQQCHNCIHWEHEKSGYSYGFCPIHHKDTGYDDWCEEYSYKHKVENKSNKELLNLLENSKLTLKKGEKEKCDEDLIELQRKVYNETKTEILNRMEE